MLFILDTKNYIPTKLCKMTGSIHLFKITGTLTYENVKLKRNTIWDIIEIDWKEVQVTLNGNKINFPKSVTIKFRDKFKIRCLVRREPLLFHIMLKQGFTCFTLASILCKKQYNTCQIFFQRERIACSLKPQCNFLYRFFTCNLPENTIDVEVTVHTLKGIHIFRRDCNTQASMCSPMGYVGKISPIPKEENEGIYGRKAEHSQSICTQ